MDPFAATICLVNVYLAVMRLRVNARMRRLTSVIWMLSVYFGCILAYMIISGPFEHELGISGGTIGVTVDVQRDAAIFVLLSNTFLLIGEWIAFTILKQPILSRLCPFIDSPTQKFVLPLYGFGLLVSGGIYIANFGGLSYTEYVEYSGAAWSLVALQWASPSIVLFVVTQKYLMAFLGVVLFFYISIESDVRSFLLISLVPAVIAFFVIQMQRRDFAFDQRLRLLGNKLQEKRFMIAILLVIIALGVIFALFSKKRTGHVELPESSLVRGMLVVMAQERDINYSGWITQRHYLYGMLSPFYKIAGYAAPQGERTAIQAASLWFGGRTPNVFQHNPYLWYTDAFISFGFTGVAIGALWGVVFALSEFLLCRNTITFCLFIPSFVWHAYFVFRGAADNSILGYAFWLQCAVLMVLFFAMRSNPSPSPSPSPPPPARNRG